MKSPHESKRAAGLTAVFLTLALLWRAGLRRYESASS